MIIEKFIACNYTEGRNGHKPGAIVLHIAEGDEQAVTSWFNDPNNGDASAHYLVCKDGRIIHYVHEYNTAWSNGNLRNANTNNPRINHWVVNGINPNCETISIEHEGHTGQGLTPEQLAASIQLVKDICDRWYITRDRTHILGHYELDDVTRHFCPGFDDKIFNAFLV